MMPAQEVGVQWTRQFYENGNVKPVIPEIHPNLTYSHR